MENRNTVNMADGTIKIGALATLIGPYKSMGEEGIHGIELAIAEFKGRIRDKQISLLVESTNAIPDSAISAAEQLIHKDGVDFVIGPLSGNEGLAIRDYAKQVPDKVFLNGLSATQDMTLRDAAANFFSFSTNGVQWIAGLGTYAYETLGFRNIVTLAEDYSYPYTQVGGFMLKFCEMGGRVVEKLWVPLGTVNFGPVFESLPPNIDAILVVLGGMDAIRFFDQHHELNIRVPLITGSSALDQVVLHGASPDPETIIGITAAGPIADDNPDPAWTDFKQAYRDLFPTALSSPSFATHAYYMNTKAALLALEMIDGNLSHGQAEFKQVLANLEFESPTGMVRLDHNRQAIADTFVTEVARDNNGRLYNSLVKTISNVNQTLGMDEDDYLNMGRFSRNNPVCP
jgi:branched-chain amino acid transport system substrate-binding protein